jgi:hypothetical protein
VQLLAVPELWTRNIQATQPHPVSEDPQGLVLLVESVEWSAHVERSRSMRPSEKEQ